MYLSLSEHNVIYWLSHCKTQVLEFSFLQNQVRNLLQFVANSRACGLMFMELLEFKPRREEIKFCCVYSMQRWRGVT